VKSSVCANVVQMIAKVANACKWIRRSNAALPTMERYPGKIRILSFLDGSVRIWTLGRRRFRRPSVGLNAVSKLSAGGRLLLTACFMMRLWPISRGRGEMADAADLNKLECPSGNRWRRTAQSRGNLKWQSRAKPGSDSGKV
jgi:hypothetical protein